MGTAFTPAGLHHVFCIDVSGAEPSCHKVQVSISDRSPGTNTSEKNIARTPSPPNRCLPTPLYLAAVLTKCPELPRVSRPLKVKRSAASNCDFSLYLTVFIGWELEPHA